MATGICMRHQAVQVEMTTRAIVAIITVVVQTTTVQTRAAIVIAVLAHPVDLHRTTAVPTLGGNPLVEDNHLEIQPQEGILLLYINTPLTFIFIILTQQQLTKTQSYNLLSTRPKHVNIKLTRPTCTYQA